MKRKLIQIQTCNTPKPKAITNFVSPTDPPINFLKRGRTLNRMTPGPEFWLFFFWVNLRGQVPSLQTPCYDKKSNTTRPTSTPLYSTTPRTSVNRNNNRQSHHLRHTNTSAIDICHLHLPTILDVCATFRTSYFRLHTDDPYSIQCTQTLKMKAIAHLHCQVPDQVQILRVG